MPSIHLNFLCEEEQLKENTIIRVDAPASSAQTAAPSLTSLLSTSNKKSKPAKENRSFSNGNSKNTNLDQSMNDGLTSPIASLASVVDILTGVMAGANYSTKIRKWNAVMNKLI
ncbi:hypothetical protein GQX74_000373 [Glossina fuscipes]|nr:hypothetical protein GQX74_000373 [Glossina fuscipes]